MKLNHNKSEVLKITILLFFHIFLNYLMHFLRYSKLFNNLNQFIVLYRN